jgi:hypothetical protein
MNDHRNEDEQTKPGSRSRLLEIFRTKSIPAHLEIGMKILGPFPSVEDSDTFFLFYARLS